jgi:chemosensory pili system protein ChpC
MAILNSVLGSVPFMAVLVQDVPRVIRVMSDEVHSEPDATPALVESMLVDVNGESAFFPNMEYIESQLAAV